MRTPLRAGLLAVAFAVLLVAIVPMTVLADHTYAHRYYVSGRVVDAEGYPVRDVTVRVFVDSGTPIGSTGATEKAYRLYRTDCNGQYSWEINNQGYLDSNGINHAYPHIHEPRGAGKVYVAAVNLSYPTFGPFVNENQMVRQNRGTFEIEGGTFYPFFTSEAVLASKTVDVNPTIRHSIVNLQLDVARPDLRCSEQVEQFNSTYTVSGRIMKEIPRESRDGGGIVVSEPVANEEVVVTLTYNGGKTATKTVRTNDVGDYTAVLDVEEKVTSGTLRVEAVGETEEVPVDGTFHTSTVNLVQDPPLLEQKWVRFALVAGGIAVALGAAAFFLNRGSKVKGKAGKGNKR
ncbi:MAG TPA: hypothetical protein VNZ52_02530 [Candidatus Thermoplasmatota archaeon]|nr:hypothetical protein [Candidatus Thermoplasmatota archaeon]